MKLQQLQNGAFVVCLPKQLVHAKQWKAGDILKVEINSKGNLELKK